MTPLNQQFNRSASPPPSPWRTGSVAEGKRSTHHRVAGRRSRFRNPAAVLDVAFKAMQGGLTHYGPSLGYSDLRQAIASKLLRDEGVAYDQDPRSS